MTQNIFRALCQSARVRFALYTGLNDVVGGNPELCSDMLSLLHEHAKKMGWMRSEPRDGGSTQDKFRDLIDIRKTINEDEDEPVVKVRIVYT